MRVLVFVLAVILAAQEAGAQAVQLPTFEVFTVQTTVSVPDGGGASLGGIRRSLSSRNARGLPLFGEAPFLGRAAGNVGIGFDHRAGGVQARAVIHDFAGAEKALLEGAAQHDPAPGDLVLKRRLLLEPAPPGIAEIRRRKAESQTAAADRARQFIEQARAAADAGKPGVARVYYRLAAKEGDPLVRESAFAESAALATPRVAAKD